MTSIEIAAAAQAAKFLVDAMTIGVHGMQVWQEYQADLLARQQQRIAEGKPLTMADVRELLDKAHAKLNANHDKLVAAAAAQTASGG